MTKQILDFIDNTGFMKLGYYEQLPILKTISKDIKIFLKQKYHYSLRDCLILVFLQSQDFSTYEKVKQFIGNYLLDKEGEVTVFRLTNYIKVYSKLKETIESYTSNFPPEFTLTGRCELIRKNVQEFPKCPVCKINLVTWSGASKLLTYCSRQCSTNSEPKKTKTKQTCLERYGVSTPFKDKVAKQKAKQTRLERYGDANYNNKEKAEQTCLERYGVTNISMVPEVKKKIREKCKQTMLEKYGVEINWHIPGLMERRAKRWLEKYGVKNISQLPEITHKIIVSSYKTKKYKNTGLHYQASHEEYFLRKLEEIKIIEKAKNNIKGYKYFFNEKELYYFPDFELNDLIVEIKSSWTYNKNGTDKELELKNEAKWQAVRDSGREIVILKSKQEIDLFVKNYLPKN